ncbi:protein SAWADEE HOMEODOMAIN HOMOLOG 1 [Impatiens glandulifera]|uniref:protein SAWADEE HOMEODOMAIN HOMOLOG 1 n=1 Tax=Impatiens glandulifera TaxID=253017 RepID=UPI001FB08785|nr:protein SAWADEE HOMEODOMAIN HOMOLOG 1 [Impatiens glandulifera]
MIEFGLIAMEDELSEPEFTLNEVLEMEKLYRSGKRFPSLEFCQELATKFSCSKHRSGNTVIRCEQVCNWFRDRKELLSLRLASSLLEPEETLHTPRVRSPPRTKKCIGEILTDLTELTFEAKSSRDYAWYDVASFMSYRVVSSGELEVRVRFAGFSSTHDEWINVSRNVRERSIPMEPSECGRLKVGDLVLCYRQNDDHALYSDAYVLEIERSIHEENCCTCKITVRFDYDDAMQMVELTNLCCRPSS